MTYLSSAALVALSGDPILEAATDAQKDGWRAAAILALEEYAHQSFELRAETLHLDGNGRATLPIPARAETVRTVTAGGLQATDVTLTSDHAALRVNPFGLTWLERAQAREWGGGRWFPRGEGNIVIEGDFGWAETPETVQRALAEEMAEQARLGEEPLSASVDAYRKLGIQSMSQGNLAFSLAAVGGTANPRGLSAGALALIPRALVWRSGAGFVV